MQRKKVSVTFAYPYYFEEHVELVFAKMIEKEYSSFILNMDI
jgi:hypothetical protein